MAVSDKDVEMTAEMERLNNENEEFRKTHDEDSVTIGRLRQETERLSRKLEWSKKDNDRLQAEVDRLREEIRQMERCENEIVRTSRTYQELHRYRKGYERLFDESADLKRTIEELREENEQLKKSTPTSVRRKKGNSGRKPKVPEELRELIVRAHENRTVTIRELVKIINSAKSRSKLRDWDDCPDEILDIIDMIEKNDISINVSKSTVQREIDRARKKTDK